MGTLVASVPLTIEGVYPTVETECSHEINNRDGVKQVQEKLVMNFDPGERAPFVGQQHSLTQYGPGRS